jgi:farnesyl diphosphate synthase
MSLMRSSVLADRIHACTAEIETILTSILTATPADGEIFRPARLLDVMRYGALDGGKRLRPFLLTESAALLGGGRAGALLAGAALECVHCYSLIHDDLPAMDDSDLRRGRPSAHKAFGEATAILAGDALLTLAFDVITRDAVHDDPAVRVALTRELARAAGIGGMAGGQMLDLENDGRFGRNAPAPASTVSAQPAPADIARLQAMKTGALFRFACRAGALLSRADATDLDRLDAFGRAFGEAFQIADDLLDVEGDAATLGKTTGQDAAAGKITFISLMGVDGARKHLRQLVEQADAALDPFGARSDTLRSLARFAAERRN